MSASVSARAPRGQVGVDGLAGDEQVHDLGRALEDPVDPQVAQHLLGRHRALAAGRSESAVSYPRPPRTCTSSSAISQAISLAHSLASAASIRMSLRAGVGQLRGQLEHRLEPEGGRGDERDLPGDRAVRADRAAPLHPLADHSRAILRHHLPPAAHIAGIDSRPVLSVVSAILRPWPSLPSRFSAGTRTWWNRVTPFSSPLSPMKALRFSTVMPGGPSTTKAVIPPLLPVVRGHPCHHDDQLGDDTVGGPQLHPVEHVRRAVVGSVAVRAHPGRVGADVGLGEQERGDRRPGAAGQERPASAPRCRTASPARARRSTGGPTPAPPGSGGPTRSASAPCRSRTSTGRARRTPGDLHAERPDSASPSRYVVGDLRLALDHAAVDLVADLAQPGQELLAAGLVLGVGARVRVDQDEVEVAEVELLGEARARPSRSRGRPRRRRVTRVRWRGPWARVARARLRARLRVAALVGRSCSTSLLMGSPPAFTLLPSRPWRSRGRSWRAVQQQARDRSSTAARSG